MVNSPCSRSVPGRPFQRSRWFRAKEPLMLNRSSLLSPLVPPSASPETARVISRLPLSSHPGWRILVRWCQNACCSAPSAWAGRAAKSAQPRPRGPGTRETDLSRDTMLMGSTVLLPKGSGRDPAMLDLLLRPRPPATSVRRDQSLLYNRV
jgi:hypothetical protein